MTPRSPATLPPRPLPLLLLFLLPMLFSCRLFPGAVDPGTAGVISYRASARIDGDLLVEASFPGPPGRLTAPPRTAPFLREVSARRPGGELLALAPEPDGSFAPPAAAREFRWTFALDEAARGIGRIAHAARVGKAWLSPPSAWLLRPVHLADGAEVELRIEAPDGLRFATGLREESPGDVYRFPAEHLSDLPYSVLGPFESYRLPVGTSRLEVARLPGSLRVSDRDLVRWIERCARAVEGYFGRYPVDAALVIVAPGHRAVASASGTGGASIFLPLSRRTSSRSLDRDWVLVHEMIHLAVPQTAPAHSWLDEGIATYVEPIARARLGQIPEEKVWEDLVEGLPQGLPRPGDRGLDHTPTWGRTYWGGALFCLLADLEIHDRTGGTRGLEDALREIVAQGGNITRWWTIEQVIRAGDAGAGAPVLRELYDRMKASPYPVDLDALFERLGVIPTRGGVAFDDSAPRAAFRRRLTARTES